MIQPLLVHTCTINTRLKKQRLNYDQGTTTLTEDETVVGAASGATATIDEIILSSGAWVAGDAAGYLILSDVVGTFKDNEAITITSTGGAAVANGANIDYKNAGGEYLFYYKSTTGIECRFYTSSRRLVISEPGEYVKRPTKVLLMADTAIQEADKVTTTTTGFSGTYKVMGVYQQYAGDSTPHHIECDLEAVPA